MAVWIGAIDWNLGSVHATGVLGGVGGEYSVEEKGEQNLFWQIVCEMSFPQSKILIPLKVKRSRRKKQAVVQRGGKASLH